VRASAIGARRDQRDAGAAAAGASSSRCTRSAIGSPRYSVLAGRAELAKTIARISGLKALSVLPAGAVPPNPQELLTRLPYDSLMVAVQGHYDVVLVDTPAGNQTADVLAITARTQGALIVARNNKTSVDSLQTLQASLQNSGVALVGSLLNNG